MTFEKNRFHSIDGVIRHSVTEKGEIVGEKPLDLSESNQCIEAVIFDRDSRVFKAGELMIDLSDVGPRSKCL